MRLLHLVCGGDAAVVGGEVGVFLFFTSLTSFHHADLSAASFSSADQLSLTGASIHKSPGVGAL